MANASSSQRWKQRQANDPYVLKAQKEGYRSRAVYKLAQIHQRDRIINANTRHIVDLGSAPGGWSQWLGQNTAGNTKIIATDILPMDPLNDVEFIQGDFTEQAVLDQLLAAAGDNKMDLVVSDMAPNLSGIKTMDQARSMLLVELAAEAAGLLLKPKGDFLVKVFQGAEFDQYIRDLRSQYQKVLTRKPEASRKASREVYILARGFKG